MIAPEEWRTIPLEARLLEHASHTEDELLRDDLIQAVKKLDKLSADMGHYAAEILRLERLAAIQTPY